MNTPQITTDDLVIQAAVGRRARPERKRRTTGSTRAASEKQLAFAAVLVAEKCGGVPDDVDMTQWQDLSVAEVSALIDRLKKGPKHVNTDDDNRTTILSGPPATEKQVAFVRRLVEQKGADAPDYDALTKSQASAMIDDLLKRRDDQATPKQAPANDAVPAGHYAVTGDDGTTDFYRVDRPTKGKWAGWTFVKLQVSDDYRRVPQANTAAVLKKIEDAGPREAAIRYGHELGKCAVCNRTLTNNDSIEAGIGPVCASNNGW